MSSDTKASVGIGMILAAVVALLVVLYLLYHFTMGNSGQPTVSKENAPDYAKKAAAKAGGPAGGPPVSGYGEGAQHRAGGGSGPPQNMRGMMGGQGGMGGPPGYAGQGGYGGGAPGSGPR